LFTLRSKSGSVGKKVLVPGGAPPSRTGSGCGTYRQESVGWRKSFKKLAKIRFHEDWDPGPGGVEKKEKVLVSSTKRRRRKSSRSIFCTYHVDLTRETTSSKGENGEKGTKTRRKERARV